MRYVLIVLLMLFGLATSAIAQVSIGIGLPGVNIGINLPLYPEFERVPGYPVYYAPRLNSNYFFYDGMYWVYQGDNWYASSWYNGPWGLVDPGYVPLYVLRIPVRYYRNRPEYFRGWRTDAPPRWGEHWGNDWEQQRRGWDKWNRGSVPAPAPLPVYQRKYSGDRYPRVEQQQALHSQNYRYQPRDAVVRQHYQEHELQRAPAPAQRGQQKAPQERSPRQQDSQRSNQPPVQQSAPPRAQPPQKEREDVHRSAPPQAPAQQKGPAVRDQRQQPPQGAAQREPQAPRSSQANSPQGKGASPEPKRGQEQEKDRGKGEERGQERNK
jgi:hypothetical protein